MMHEKAVDAALAVLAAGFSLGGPCDDDRKCAERAIATFLRAWKPWDPVATRNECDVGRRLARYAADELEGKP
jgi:hypothetical protein